MPKRRVSVQAARDLLWGVRGAPGLIEDVIGFVPATGGLKNVHYYISPRTAHEFLTWRRSLREFAPLLFQN